MSKASRPDFAKIASLLGIPTAALEDAYKQGFDTGVDASADYLSLAPYGTLNINAKNKVVSARWDREALKHIEQDIQALKGDAK